MLGEPAVPLDDVGDRVAEVLPQPAGTRDGGDPACAPFLEDLARPVADVEAIEHDGVVIDGIHGFGS